jgi:hypothetical protein
MAGTTIFPTIPNPGSNLGTVIAAVQALTQCVNLLIINAQSTSAPGHLSGANAFVPSAVSTFKLNQASSTTAREVAVLQREIMQLRRAVVSLGGKL